MKLLSKSSCFLFFSDTSKNSKDFFLGLLPEIPNGTNLLKFYCVSIKVSIFLKCFLNSYLGQGFYVIGKFCWFSLRVLRDSEGICWSERLKLLWIHTDSVFSPAIALSISDHSTSKIILFVAESYPCWVIGNGEAAKYLFKCFPMSR